MWSDWARVVFLAMLVGGDVGSIGQLATPPLGTWSAVLTFQRKLKFRMEDAVWSEDWALSSRFLRGDSRAREMSSRRPRN